VISFKIKNLEVFADNIKNSVQKVQKEIEEDVKKSVKALAVGVFKKAESLSRERLPGSLDDIYRKNLYIEQISDNVLIVGLKKDALWIEEGRKSGFMDELFKGPGVKTSKEGHKYRSIPLGEKAISSISTDSGQDILKELKVFLRNRGIRYNKTKGLELDEKGSPRVGKIHSFNIKDLARSGSKNAQSLSRNIQSFSVFQNVNKSTGKVERNIVTFRTISEKHKEQGKWNHPGRPAENIFQDLSEWVEKEWQNNILPELQKKYGG